MSCNHPQWTLWMTKKLIIWRRAEGSIKMMSLSTGVTRMDRIRNEDMGRTTHVRYLGDEAKEAGLRWFCPEEEQRDVWMEWKKNGRGDDDGAAELELCPGFSSINSASGLIMQVSHGEFRGWHWETRWDQRTLSEFRCPSIPLLFIVETNLSCILFLAFLLFLSFSSAVSRGYWCKKKTPALVWRNRVMGIYHFTGFLFLK